MPATSVRALSCISILETRLQVDYTRFRLLHIARALLLSWERTRPKYLNLSLLRISLVTYAVNRRSVARMPSAATWCWACYVVVLRQVLDPLWAGVPMTLQATCIP